MLVWVVVLSIFFGDGDFGWAQIIFAQMLI